MQQCASAGMSYLYVYSLHSYVTECACAATCILFGDGCGAVLLSVHDGACSLLGSSLHSDGNGQKHLKARLPLCALAVRCA